MRPRSHQRNGETFVYLQVPKNHHKCSFIAVVHPREWRLLRSDPAKRELQDEATELVMHLTTPPNKHELKPHLPQKRDRKGALRRQPATKVQTLGQTSRPLKRQHTLSSIPGLSTTAASRSSAGKLPHSIIHLDSDGEDAAPPPYSLPVPSRSGAGIVDRYTDNEARLNMVGDEPLMALTRSRHKELLKDREYPCSFWLLDGPNGQRYADPRFPARLSLYVFGGSFATWVIDTGPVGPRPITQFIFAIATTDGVSGPTYTNFLNMLRVCFGCGGHFTPPAFNQHLIVAGNFHLCGNHPSRPIVLSLSVATLPIPIPRPYREFGSLTALGITLSALNTKLGLPDDVFQAVRLGLILCIDCGRIRTVHVHLAHSPGGVCPRHWGTGLLLHQCKLDHAGGDPGQWRAPNRHCPRRMRLAFS
ncbi:hypothetical protein B0H14DRAFT_2601852 [Mycena olivaceomarginata]|nr:hypothetical protein B0H14DRAFT_2601852 [Mycena olivaceomarginata]